MAIRTITIIWKSSSSRCQRSVMWNRLAHTVVVNQTHHDAEKTKMIHARPDEGWTCATASEKIKMAATKIRS